jgi:hypothetical protein
MIIVFSINNLVTIMLYTTTMETLQLDHKQVIFSQLDSVVQQKQVKVKKLGAGHLI